MMLLSKCMLSTLAALALATAATASAASEPMYRNYPLDQREMSAAPEYLPQVGATRAAGQVHNGYFEPTYLNYPKQAGNQPYRHHYTGDHVPSY